MENTSIQETDHSKTKQSHLIGEHPQDIYPFGDWLFVKDHPHTDTKCHRELTEVQEAEQPIIEWFARKLITHHYQPRRINRLKEKYTKLGYPKYAEQYRKLPNDDKTRKGNTTEILLLEYLQSSLRKELTHAYRLRYNPNVDQSMKGDDVLLIDIIEDETLKIYLGEAKFRTTPDKKSIIDITNSLKRDTLPLSYTFLVDKLALENPRLADKLDDFIIEEIKNRGDLIYAGLLLSNTNTSRLVETHLDTANPNLVFISLGLDNPNNLITDVFNKASELIENPEQL